MNFNRDVMSVYKSGQRKKTIINQSNDMIGKKMEKIKTKK